MFSLKQHAVIDHPQYGKIYAYEVNGFGSYNLMNDQYTQDVTF